eukprot:CAMPEP_0177686420 /NCGR_PEP_ID=MMETSP0447-20121125/33558_1 /TAXON_ID=0 /ORGANISM="Stygamoeba regulata, Strain BSH-02190019" /LENGTH=454 /DNA_ID=CAMNT_0019196539 /DNA_START=277 /DNA_END=1638 /DNA_ORIENTATION=+
MRKVLGGLKKKKGGGKGGAGKSNKSNAFWDERNKRVEEMEEEDRQREQAQKDEEDRNNAELDAIAKKHRKKKGPMHTFRRKEAEIKRRKNLQKAEKAELDEQREEARANFRARREQLRRERYKVQQENIERKKKGLPPLPEPKDQDDEDGDGVPDGDGDDEDGDDEDGDDGEGEEEDAPPTWDDIVAEDEEENGPEENPEDWEDEDLYGEEEEEEEPEPPDFNVMRFYWDGKGDMEFVTERQLEKLEQQRIEKHGNAESTFDTEAKDIEVEENLMDTKTWKEKEQKPREQRISMNEPMRFAAVTITLKSVPFKSNKNELEIYMMALDGGDSGAGGFGESYKEEVEGEAYGVPDDLYKKNFGEVEEAYQEDMRWKAEDEAKAKANAANANPVDEFGDLISAELKGGGQSSSGNQLGSQPGLAGKEMKGKQGGGNDDNPFSNLAAEAKEELGGAGK